MTLTDVLESSFFSCERTAVTSTVRSSSPAERKTGLNTPSAVSSTALSKGTSVSSEKGTMRSPPDTETETSAVSPEALRTCT